VFGPSNPLYSLVLPHLPVPDLTRLVLQYASPLLPRQGRYQGNAILSKYTTVQYAPSASCPSFSLARRSFSWSGWLYRTEDVDRQFLLEVCSIPSSAGGSQRLHCGYRYNRFTFGFFHNDLDSPAHQAGQRRKTTWEHWAGTFHFPRSEQLHGAVMPHEHSSDAPASELGRRRLYRDGQLVAEDDCRPLLVTADNRILLGAASYDHALNLKGGICDVRLYSRALSEEEVAALYEGEDGRVDREGLEAEWRLETGGALAEDSSGHGRHGTVTGNPNSLLSSRTGEAAGVQIVPQAIPGWWWAYGDRDD
jgi:hypothetical protein